MARKPNYEFERRERDRLKAIKVAEKAQAKKEARERARQENAGPASEITLMMWPRPAGRIRSMAASVPFTVPR